MKNLFNAERLRLTARQLAALHARFDPAAFLAHALRDLDTLELMDRLRRTAGAFDHALPLPFAEQLPVLFAHAPKSGTASSPSGPANTSPAAASGNPPSPCPPCANSPATARPSSPSAPFSTAISPAPSPSSPAGPPRPTNTSAASPAKAPAPAYPGAKASAP